MYVIWYLILTLAFVMFNCSLDCAYVWNWVNLAFHHAVDSKLTVIIFMVIYIGSWCRNYWIPNTLYMCVCVCVIECLNHMVVIIICQITYHISILKSSSLWIKGCCWDPLCISCFFNSWPQVQQYCYCTNVHYIIHCTKIAKRLSEHSGRMGGEKIVGEGEMEGRRERVMAEV